MIERTDLAIELAPVTDGTIAVVNLESAREQSWSRFWRAPERQGIAELIVEQELLTAQFCGDPGALDRLDTLVNQLVRVNSEAAQTSLIAAQVASATHRFAEARTNLAQAAARGTPADAVERVSLSLDQATGVDLHRVLVARRQRAAQPGRLEELVPLGALLADLGEFDEAESTYHQALREYRDASPFALAWVCFELGELWGERVSTPRVGRAAQWYRTAIGYLPCYVRARVHLAEILLDQGNAADAGNLLRPVTASGDPEVYWRLAEVAEATANAAEGKTWVEAARSGFESLLARHPLAFADHAAEFYLAGGADPAEAFALARLNLANRSTLRAFELAVDAAHAAGEFRVAAELAADARQRWAGSEALRSSRLEARVNARDSASNAYGESPAGGGGQEGPAHART
jgi:tetratricopeptide (TPR) repeat protein